MKVTTGYPGYHRLFFTADNFFYVNLCNLWLIIQILISLLLGVSITGYSQDRPKIGLALSGGGAKGFSHVGVLKVLEEVQMPIDYITGTSMGSIIGGLYAIGYKADDLEELALSTDWASLFTDHLHRPSLGMDRKIWDGRYTLTLSLKKWKIQLPSGLVAGQNITRLMNRLILPAQHIHDFREFPIPFSCVATDIVNGDAVVLDKGDLLDAMRASMAIPTAFTPIRINDRLLVDGGLVRNLPAEDAHNLGADIVIGVDVGAPLRKEKELNSFLSILDQTTSFQMVESTKEQRKNCDYLLVPDMGEFSTFDFDQAEFFIQQGENAAREIYDELKSLADSLNKLSSSRPVPDPPEIDSLYITAIAIEGLKNISEQLVLRQLNIKYPLHTTVDELEKATLSLYNTQFFERVNYRLEPGENSSILIVKVVEKSDDLFRVGIRYDSKNDASILLNTTFRNLGKFGAFLVFDLKLGGDLFFDGQYFAHTGLHKRLGIRARANFAQQHIDYYEDEIRTARYRVNSAIAEGIWGTIFSTKMVLGIGARAEYVEADPTIGSADFVSVTERQGVILGTLTADTYDRVVFPTSGMFLQFMNEYSNKALGSQTDFRRHFIDLRLAIPFHSRLSFQPTLFLGTTSKNEVPFNYLFFLGGMDLPFTYFGRRNSFLGVKAQELSGKNAQFLQLGVQYEFLDRKFILLRWNAGNTFEEWTIDFEKNTYITGGGVTLGMNSFLGPIEFTMMGGTRHRFLTHLNVGFKF